MQKLHKLQFLAVSNRFPEALELFAGITHANEYKVDVSVEILLRHKGLIISITVMEMKRRLFIEMAKQTDLLVVTGDIGAAYMGLQVLERETSFQVNPQPDLDAYTYLIERQLKPEAKRRSYLIACLEIKPTSMIDISDGLSSEIMHLCSQIGCNLYEDKYLLIPVDYVCERI
jgi:thiamine-monophosphate kinase